MANPEHLATLKQGVAAWNDWRLQGNSFSIDLSSADLSHLDLSGFNLRNVNLGAANLSQAILDETGFTYTLRTEIRATDLRDSELTEANLSGAFIRGVSFNNATLIRADLTGAVICRADLDGTDFQSSIAGWGSFDNLDLRRARHLDTIHHDGPSSVGIDTIGRSRGEIPEVFCAGAAFPMRSLCMPSP